MSDVPAFSLVASKQLNPNFQPVTFHMMISSDYTTAALVAILVRKGAAIHMNRLPCYERSIVGCEKGTGGRDLFRQPQSAHRNAHGASVSWPCKSIGLTRRGCRIECAGHDVVHEDVMFRKLGCECASQA